MWNSILLLHLKKKSFLLTFDQVTNTHTPPQPPPWQIDLLFILYRFFVWVRKSFKQHDTFIDVIFSLLLVIHVYFFLLVPVYDRYGNKRIKWDQDRIYIIDVHFWSTRTVYWCNDWLLERIPRPKFDFVTS